VVQDALSIYENRATDMKSHNNLIELIASPENLLAAYERTAKAKRDTYGYLEFKEFKHLNLELIRQELLAGEYKIGKYRIFTIYEPKARVISALSFKDRLIQHALCNIIGPIFEATLLPNTFACRVGKGTHAGVKYIQSQLRKDPEVTHFLKTDYSKFFPSIIHNVLLKLIHRKITCKLTLKMIEEIIKPDEIGLPIGSLTSQLFANVYGSLIDHFIHHVLKHRRWARYMDDIIILGNSMESLREDFLRIQEFSFKEMGMKISKWACSSINRGINFLGYRIWHSHKLLRKDSVQRAKKKIARYTKHNQEDKLTDFIASWKGHITWSNSHNLLL
jgi:retron-type reverse transcriptase